MADTNNKNTKGVQLTDRNMLVPVRVFTNEFTRPNDTNAYAAGDVIGTSTTGPVLQSINLELGWIVNAKLVSGKTGGTIPAGNFRVHLYNSTITAINDNSVFTMLYANKDKRIGYIDFSCIAGGSGSDAVAAIVTNINILNQFTTLYLVYESLGAYTPVAQQNFYLELTLNTL